jgi:galactosylceramidase
LFVFFTNYHRHIVNDSFIYKGIIALNSGTFTLDLPVGVVYTVSTINGTKSTYEPPPSMPFPLPYEDDFNRYATSSEAAYFADQSGSWEIVDTPYPFSVLGDSWWKQPLNISADVMIESNGTAFIAIGVERGSCAAVSGGSPAIVFSINTTNNGLWQLTASTALRNPLTYGSVPIMSGTWYTLTLIALEDHSEAYVNGNLVGRCDLKVSSFDGLVAIGSSWDYVQFDNFRLQSPKQGINN